MKKRVAKALIGLATVGTFTDSASAAWYEGFDYTANPSSTALSLAGNQNLNSLDNWPNGNGPQTGGNIWTASSTPAANNDADVLSGNLSYTGLPWSPTGNKAAIQAASQRFDRVQVDQHYGTGDGGPVVYYSMLMRVTNMTPMTGLAVTGGFFTGLQYYPLGVSPTSDNMSANSATSGAPILIRRADGIDPNVGYQLGIAHRDAPAATTRVFNNLVNFVAGDTVFLIVKMDFGTIAAGSKDDVATLWAFRDNGTTADAIPLTEPGTVFAQSVNTALSGVNDYFDNVNPLGRNIRSIIVRGGNTFIPDMELDEIRVGNTWDQVIGVPEPAGLAMLSLGAVAMLRRRPK